MKRIKTHQYVSLCCSYYNSSTTLKNMTEREKAGVDKWMSESLDGYFPRLYGFHVSGELEY